MSDTQKEYGEQWNDLIVMYFGIALPADHAEAWWREIQSDFKGADNAELCRAVRWASDDRNWKRKGRPDLSTLKLWMGINRKLARDEGRPDQEGCGLCRHGFVDHWPDIEARPSVDQQLVSYCCHVPCGCRAGVIAMGRVLSHGPQEDLESRRKNLEAMFQKARAQAAVVVDPDYAKKADVEEFDPDAEWEAF